MQAEQAERWYLIARCRLRDAVRGFRLGRVPQACRLDEIVPPRPFGLAEPVALGRGKAVLSGVVRAG
ncbi:WYL domain-containing protein [Streptomyces sp. NPDC048434]|uniref:WYL domain-containing protein n=1 Tax=Streptomyces sp. NPDC048434 TaxID=3365549 RepID=UPI003721F2FE